jgi:WD40 repeat protein
VRQHHKKEREFNRMFLAQELTGSKNRSSNDKAPGLTTSEVPSKSSKGDIKGAVWATEFSRDGKYLAAAGQDQTVRVWSVISTAEERQAHERDEDASNGEGERLSAPVFRSKPVREFEGHTSVVLDLSWSKNNFLLSSSMDKTVRLWHVSRQECLCTFKHKDFVTSIAFHPRDDRFFLAGSLDSVLRLWSIPDKSVAFWSQLPDLITAVAFTPDGKMAMAGVLGGLCLFYETEGLKYNTQIHVRSSRGKNAKGSKITGIRTCIYPPNDLNGEVKVLITSNDSRVRLYNLRDKTLEMKFRGHENSCSQIKASFSDDAKYIICGSEDRKAYVWSTGPMDSDTKDKRQVEMFEAHSDMVTAAVMAPAKTRLLLSASGDPLYDLCNPPPVTLLSRGESNISSKPPTVNDGENRNSDPVSEAASILKKPEESPAYLARSQHQDGNIIITADHTGNIKVFRQDCAFQKRRNDTWETASSFSRKIGQGKLGRASSIMTRASASSHSRRNSLGQNSISTQLPSDRILSWRNSVASNGSLETGSIRTAQTSVRSERSVSPAKVPRGPNASFNQSTPTLASTARQQPYSGTPNMSATTSPPQSLHKTTSGPRKAEAPKVTQPPTPSFSLYAATDDNNPLRLDGTGKSYQFWNMHNWRNQFGSNNSNSNNASSNSNPSERDPSRLGSNLGLALSGSKSLDTTSSVVSKLSDELEDFQEARTGEATDSEEEEAVSCQKCGGKDFRARRGGRLVCTKCGTGAAAE